MGQIKKGILGGVSGKVGNVVGGSWKGIDYLRVLPASVTNPKTINQTTVRTKFAMLVRFLRSFTPLIRLGFKSEAVKQTSFNAAMSYNYHHAIAGEYPDLSIDYASVAVSRGDLPGAVNPVAASEEAAKVSISWEPNTGQPKASDTDVAIAVVYNPEQQDAIYTLDAAPRSEGSATLDVPASYSGQEVHVYMAFMVLDQALGGQSKQAISNSAYAGSVTVM